MFPHRYLAIEKPLPIPIIFLHVYLSIGFICQEIIPAAIRQNFRVFQKIVASNLDGKSTRLPGLSKLHAVYVISIFTIKAFLFFDVLDDIIHRIATKGDFHLLPIVNIRFRNAEIHEFRPIDSFLCGVCASCQGGHKHQQRKYPA